MSQLQEMFEGQNLTIFQNGDDVHFLLKDVCNILEIGHVATVKKRLEDDVVSNYPIQDSLGRTQTATFVNEDGLYDVVLDSRKPEAKRFRKWITSEVLPSIRKTGSYSAKALSPKEQRIELLKLSLEQEEKITEHDQRITNLEQNMRIDGAQEYRINLSGKSKVLETLGGKKSAAYEQLGRKAFSAFWTEFKRYFEIPRYSELPKVRFDEALKFIEMWQPDTGLRMEIESANRQTRLGVI